MDLRRFQEEHREWVSRNFGLDRPSYQALLGALEELGELANAHLKGEQKIRGSAEKHEAAARDAVGDVVIYLVDYCTLRGWNFAEILELTWEHVRRRDWKKNPQDGSVLPNA